MITIAYTGRRGNTLFQMFAATLFSIKFKDGIANLRDNKILHYDALPLQQFDTTMEVTNSNFIELLNKSQGGVNFNFADYYQTEEAVAEFDRNRHCLTKFDDSPINGVFVHVRLGDLLPPFHNENRNKHVPFEYYDLALSNLHCNDGYIASDSPNHDIVTHLANKHNLRVLNASEDDTIMFASKFNNKVLSFGTFSWWIGFLGNQSCVIYPDEKWCLKWYADIFTLKHWKKV